ncbi:hypothetical protein F2Q70_00029163 [Brassica cretica]|uniref:Uncharacterized protein n=1 Tax=Brassica cretica TaxID=69181 RepID=A0A8S9FBT8_BRACR|nr:hypothetical protein F2Q70_00029163 [Brassica cretica]
MGGKNSGSPSGHANWGMTQRVRRRRQVSTKASTGAKTREVRTRKEYEDSSRQATTPMSKISTSSKNATTTGQLKEQHVLSGEPHRHVSLRSERRSSRLTLKQTTESTDWSKTQGLERRKQQRISQSSGSRISDLTQI